MKITLNMIRQARGLSFEDVVMGCGLPIETIEMAHRDFGEVPISVGKKLLEFYKIPTWHIYINPEDEFVNKAM